MSLLSMLFRSVLAVATVGGAAFAPLTVPTTEPSLAVVDSGQVATPDQVSVLDAKVTAPVSMVGQTASTMRLAWDPSAASFDPTTLVYPEGWTLEYTVDGTTWSSTPPGNLALVQGVQATGSVDS